MNIITDQESLLGVTSSLLRYYGAETSHNTLPLLDGRLAACPRNVVLLLFDGMGDAVVRGHLPEDSFLRRHMAAVIGTVFPPTTAAAITTVDSGLSPAEHGWLGWSLRFGALGGKIVEVFTNRSDGEPAADYSVAGRFSDTGACVSGYMRRRRMSRRSGFRLFRAIRCRTADRRAPAAYRSCAA